MPDDDEMVTVRFLLADTRRTKDRHPYGPKYDAYNGTVLRWFAQRPVMWWPEGALSGIAQDELAESEIRSVGERPSDPALLEMRVPRRRLVGERTPYTIVEQAAG